MKQKSSIPLLVLFLLITSSMAQKCKPSGKVRGKNPPNGECNHNNDSDCCKEGKLYNIYKCSPSVSQSTKATLTINSFQAGGEGGGPSECDGKYHEDDTAVVALSTGWFNNRKRCHDFITIHGNGKSTKAMVVDECDSTMGCDEEHSYQPPCANNIVDASKAVWKALGVKETDDRWGLLGPMLDSSSQKCFSCASIRSVCVLVLFEGIMAIWL